ncbi:CPCC family cysteine-rich protein [Herbidospora mongoliensis]|uniref:CPCC family cysteine-rich protein n=1 Tax=Herbidospora mongoliensis TaxID=688067 RepID=UPI000B10F411|nr:CPCC family cysteine-rich protein [Herbidospora mongoliensis]
MASDTLELEWRLIGTGVAQILIGDGTTSLSETFGNQTDALADFLHGMTALYGPLTTNRFFFDAEPAEIRWVTRRDGELIEISVYRFGDVAVSLDLPDSAGDLVWRSVRSRARLAHAAVTAAQGLLAENDDEGYLAKWIRHPFPVNALRELLRLHAADDGCDMKTEAGLGWFHWYTGLRSVDRPAGEGPHACPCCGYLTLGQRAMYEICSVCFWEDDGQDDHDADVIRHGPNGALSLTQARSNFADFGANRELDLPKVRNPRPHEYP